MMNNKLSFDKYDINTLLLAKGWFDKELIKREKDKVWALKKIFGKRCSINPECVTDVAIFQYLLHNFITPYILPSMNDTRKGLEEMLLDASPANCVLIGYDKGNYGIFADQTFVNPEYNYIHAMIYSFLSQIRRSTVEVFPKFSNKDIDFSLID